MKARLEEDDMPGTERVEITGPYGDRYDEILTPQAIDLIAVLHAEPGPRRSELLTAPPPSGRTLRRRDARLPARDGRDPRGRQLARYGARAGPGRPPGGDHRPDG